MYEGLPIRKKNKWVLYIQNQFAIRVKKEINSFTTIELLQSNLQIGRGQDWHPLTFCKSHLLLHKLFFFLFYSHSASLISSSTNFFLLLFTHFLQVSCLPPENVFFFFFLLTFCKSHVFLQKMFYFFFTHFLQVSSPPPQTGQAPLPHPPPTLKTFNASLSWLFSDKVK